MGTRDPVQPRRFREGYESASCAGNNTLTRVKSTSIITIEIIIKASKADTLAPEGKEGMQRITTRLDSLNKTDRHSLTNQAAVIGAKEGAAEAIYILVDSNNTNDILCLPDGNDYDGMDKYTLHKVIKAVIAGSDRPANVNVLDQLVEIINFALNFQTKISTSVELLQVKAAQMATYGIDIVDPQIGLTILANIKIVA